MKGQVFSGEGKASKFLSMKPYSDFIADLLGSEPFPGTLNLRVDQEEAENLKEDSESYRMDSTEFEGRELGGITVFPVNIEGIEALVVEPDLTRYGEDVLEVVAAEELRASLEVEDGEHLEIEASS